MNGVVSASDEVGSRCEDRSAVLQCCLMSVKVLEVVQSGCQWQFRIINNK